MSVEWRKSTWGDEISLEYGKALRGYTDAEGPVRVFGTNGPIGWTTEPLASGPGIIVGRKGAYRGVHYSATPFFVIDTAYYVVPKTELDMRWLYYAIIHYKLGELDDGSPIPSTTRSAVYVRDLEVPPLEEQRSIAAILGSFDDKINLNHKTNRTLEAMVRAIFQSWFIDFDPIKAKAQHATSFPGMSQTIFNDLPSRLVESELGAIPKGWDHIQICDLVEVIGGGTPNTKEPLFWEDGVHPFCTPKDMSKLASPILLDTKRHITDSGVEKISSGQLPIGTVLLSSRAPIGYLAITETPVSVNQGIIAMQTGDVSNIYILLWTEANMETIKSRSGGSTFAEISKSNFRPIPALRPTDEVLAAFDELVRPLYERVVSNLRESVTLMMLRDTLLPVLVSGKISACQ